MNKQQLRQNLIGVVAVALSFALGITLYQSFLVADLDDLDEELKSAPTPAPKQSTSTNAEPKKFTGGKQVKRARPAKRTTPNKMKEFSGHGMAVSDNLPDNEKVSSNKQMIGQAKSSEMLT